MDKELQLYTKVYATLIALTLISVGFFSMHLARVAAIVIALSIATVKGSAIAYYFMHLKEESPMIYTIAIVGVITVATLAIGILPDLAWRW